VAAAWNGEPVIFGEVGELFVAVDLHGGGVLFVVYVGDPLEEDEREDVLLVVAGVDEAAQDDRGTPKVGLQFTLADACRAHADAPNPQLASSASNAVRVFVAFAWAASKSASASASVTFVAVSREAT
jgi:hypothetical protein